MSRTYFEFKQFVVHHDRCAMKVGTDGVLLGAWADVAGAGSILDVGCGSGLVALMCAQRSSGTVLGIDIDADAVAQSMENGSRSPWAQRVAFRQADVRTFCPEEQFDALVCNPPFFENSLHCPDERRSMARHTTTLPLPELAEAAAGLLADEGTFSVVLPAELGRSFVMPAWEHGLNLYRRCTVCTKADKPAKRVLLGFKKGGAEPLVESTLELMNPEGTRSEAYEQLTKDFYLDK